jgi:MATE family multidrug resistance protein
LKKKAVPPAADAGDPPFLYHPHRTLAKMSFPVLLSLTAEPLTDLIDTAFVSPLGTESLAALGAGTMALSNFF